jgi:hypothetical protein
LSISCDVERNPGPDYPCGTCGSEVKDSDHAVECDNCCMWFHIQCQGLNSTLYQDLTNSNTSFAWTCTLCDDSNLSDISSILSISSHNRVSPPVDENTETPSSVNLKTFICINCQSIVNKKHEFQYLLIDQNPDIVTATESWLNWEHFNSEIFPPELGYTVFCCDRLKGKTVEYLSLLKTTSYQVNNQN